MSVDQAAGLDVGDRGQIAVLDVLVEIRRVLKVVRAYRLVGHDGGGVLEEVADVAVSIPRILKVRVGHVAVPLIAVVLPGDVFLEQRVADVAH